MFPTYVEDVHLQCFEILDSFLGLAPEKVEEVKKGDPTKYTLADIIRIALLARFEDLHSQMKRRVLSDEFDLQGRKFRIEISLTKWSAYNLATLGWWTSGRTRKLKRSVDSNTPVFLEFKWREFWEDEAEYESFISQCLCFAIQEILHVGPGNALRAAITSKILLSECPRQIWTRNLNRLWLSTQHLKEEVQGYNPVGRKIAESDLSHRQSSIFRLPSATSAESADLKYITIFRFCAARSHHLQNLTI